MRDNTTRILAEGVTVSNDTWQTCLNNNDLIVGPSGAGKTRGYVIPNLMTAECSLIVTDTKGVLVRECGPTLARRGYKVQLLDLTDCVHSPIGYNPLDYIKANGDKPSEQDILRVAAALCPLEDHNQPYWDLAARGLLASMIAYALEALPSEEAHLGSVSRLYEATASGAYAQLIAEMEVVEPRSFAVRQYIPTGAAKDAEKMIASVRGILGEKLALYSSAEVERLFTLPERVNFETLRREKTAVFINVSDTDRSMDRLVSLLYAQAIQALCNTSEIPGEPYLPVRMIMDDFAAGCRVADFDRIISVVRSRHLYLSIVIQSLSQLEGLYGQASAATILTNCDSLLYLGGCDMDTARYVGARANLPTHRVLDMPVGQAILFQRGAKARFVTRYQVEDHKHFEDADA